MEAVPRHEERKAIQSVSKDDFGRYFRHYFGRQANFASGVSVASLRRFFDWQILRVILCGLYGFHIRQLNRIYHMHGADVMRERTSIARSGSRLCPGARRLVANHPHHRESFKRPAPGYRRETDFGERFRGRRKKPIVANPINRGMNKRGLRTTTKIPTTTPTSVQGDILAHAASRPRDGSASQNAPMSKPTRTNPPSHI